MDTQGKIDEAHFFVSKMREKYNDRTEFKFYLSAFLSAGRSVIWVMNTEFGKVPSFKTWYDSRMLNDEENRIFKLVNDLRVETNKIKPVKTRPIVTTVIEIPADVDYNQYLNQHFEVKISSPDKDGGQTLSFIDKASGQILTGEIDDYRIVNDLRNGEDLLELCENYLRVVESLYREWLKISNSQI
jgi:hypothetical protein